jgi:hypothetical protein
LKTEEIRRRLPRLTMSLFMAFIFWIVTVFIPQTISGIVVPGLNLNADYLVWIFGMILMVIFLVRALADAIVLIDTLTDAFVRRLGIKGERSPSRALRDLIYIIVILLVATAVSPVLATIKDIGTQLRTVVTYITLGLVIILIYDIGRVIYSIIEEKAQSLADRLAKISSEETNRSE